MNPASLVRSHAGARSIPSGSTPAARIASASDTPSSSRRSSTAGEIEPAGQRLAPERRRVEARALLVGERQHGDLAARRSPRSRTRRPPRAARRRGRRPARCPGASRPPTTADRHPGRPIGCRRGRAALAARRRWPAARTTRGSSRPRRSRPAGARPRARPRRRPSPSIRAVKPSAAISRHHA